jgi:hypothetical protein
LIIKLIMSAEDIYEKINYCRGEIPHTSELNKYICLYLALKEQEDGSIDDSLIQHTCANFCNGKTPRNLKKRFERAISIQEKIISQLDKRINSCVGEIKYTIFQVPASQADKVRELLDAYNSACKTVKENNIENQPLTKEEIIEVTSQPQKSKTKKSLKNQRRRNRAKRKKLSPKVEPILPECDPNETKTPQ